MQNPFQNTRQSIIYILCFFFLISFTSNAQIRPRNKADSVMAVANHTWSWPNNYQYQIAYPKLDVIPPLSTGMDYETIIAYILVDSLMRSNLSGNQSNYYIVSNWKKARAKNDTIVAMAKYLSKPRRASYHFCFE